MAKFPPEIINFAAAFIKMQEQRHNADYDPDAEVPSRDAVIQYIHDAENVIRQFPNAPIVERRAFAVHVLVTARRS